MDRSPNPRIRSATANVARHRLVNIFIGRLRLIAQQHRRAHQLSRLAIAALRNILFQPRALQWIAQVRRQPLDRRHEFPICPRNCRNTRAHRFSIDMHRACSALRHAAPIFCSGEPELFANHPQQRSGRINLEVDPFAIDGKSDHCHSPDFLLGKAPAQKCRNAKVYILGGKKSVLTGGRPAMSVTRFGFASAGGGGKFFRALSAGKRATSSKQHERRAAMAG